tara:strand:- start:10119 stop:10448 length:330 start_codon:yes stop_codon:yes gene_type:complete
MGMINMSGSLRYGPSGKRRKTNSLSKKKIDKEVKRLKDLAAWNRDGNYEYEKQRRIPSLESKRGDGHGTLNHEWEEEKRKISSQYTIAPAYNKGAYQVIGKDSIEDIGK